MNPGAWLLAASLLAAPALAADPPLHARDFTWRAAVDVPAGASLARLEVPAAALAQLRSPHDADLRLFDAEGEPRPHAFAPAPPPAEPVPARTAPWAALPLHTAARGERIPRGGVQVRVDGAGDHGATVWVRVAPGAAASAPAGDGRRLPAALFDTRGVKDVLSGIAVQGRWPANVPIHLALATSTDLASWTPVAVGGRIYRFDGENAPANDVLKFSQPLRLEGRFLRVDWGGQEGVVIDGLAGLVAATSPPPARPEADLGAGRAAADGALEWSVPFATPIARLALLPAQADTLVPVRVLGRQRPSDPWRLVGQGVVYRLGPAGAESTSTPLTLAGGTLRSLRVEPTHGARLPGLAARAQFDPLHLVFVAGSRGPFQLVAGRAETPSAALPLGAVMTATTVRWDQLPLAAVQAGTTAPAPPAAPRFLPEGVEPRTATLWAVLAVGVLLLGGVAWSLLRQLNAAKPPA